MREVPSHTSAHAYIGVQDFTPASSGTLYGARIEAGRLRGRLVTIGGLHGSLYTDVQVDVPLWQVPSHRTLPPDGGDPGAALRALDAAVQAGDRDRLRAVLAPALAEDLPDGSAFAAQLEQTRQYFGQGHRVQQGLVSDSIAVLLSTANRRGREETVRTVWSRSGECWLFGRLEGDATELLPEVAMPKPFIEVEPEPALLADQPEVRFDEGTSMTLRHARALALASGEHVVVLSDQPLSPDAGAPASAAALSGSALSAVNGAQLAVLQLPAGGPAWNLDEIEHNPATGRRDRHLVRGKLTRIGSHLSGVLTTLRFPAAGGVETGESVLLDLEAEESVAIAARLPDMDAGTRSMIINNLATVRFSEGRAEEAQALFEQSLELTVSEFGDDHPRTATGWSNIGVSLYAQHRHREAITPLERALAIMEQTYGPAHPEVAYVLSNLVDVYRAAGDEDQAKAAQDRIDTMR